MLSSSYVQSLSRQINPLIRRVQDCSDDMNRTVQGIDTFWNGLGGEQYEDRCVQWIREMNQVKQDLVNLENRLSAYADRLLEEERRQEELRRQEEIRRQMEVQAMAQYWASRS